MGLLNEKIQGLDYANSALANYQQQAPQDLSFLDKLAIAFVPQTYANIQGQRAAMNQPQGADYKQLAEYWAQQGDPQKAAQYAELAKAQSGVARTGLAPQIGVNPETQQPEYFVMQEGGIPKFTGVAPQERAMTQQRTTTPRVPVGMMWNPESGRAEQIPGVPVKAAPMGRTQPSRSVSAASPSNTQQSIEEIVASGLTPTPKGKITETQRGTLGYTDRMLQAEQALSQINNGAPTAKTSAIGSIPLIGDYAQRLAQTPSQQLFDNASKEWIRAKLRKESGAAIGADEMQQEFNTYFPKPGDGSDVIKQKAQLRQNAMASMARQAGSSLPNSARASNQPMKSLPPASQHPGAIIKDTKFGKRFKSNGKTWEPI